MRAAHRADEGHGREEEPGWGVMLGGSPSCSKAAASHAAGKAKATKVEGENELSCQLMLLECCPAG